MSELVFTVNTEPSLNYPKPRSFLFFTNHPDHSELEHVEFLTPYLSFLSHRSPSLTEKWNFPSKGSVDHCGPLLFSIIFLLAAVVRGKRWRQKMPGLWGHCKLTPRC